MRHRSGFRGRYHRTRPGGLPDTLMPPTGLCSTITQAGGDLQEVEAPLAATSMLSGVPAALTVRARDVFDAARLLPPMARFSFFTAHLGLTALEAGAVLAGAQLQTSCGLLAGMRRAAVLLYNLLVEEYMGEEGEEEANEAEEEQVRRAVRDPPHGAVGATIFLYVGTATLVRPGIMSPPAARRH